MPNFVFCSCLWYGEKCILNSTKFKTKKYQENIACNACNVYATLHKLVTRPSCIPPVQIEINKPHIIKCQTLPQLNWLCLCRRVSYFWISCIKFNNIYTIHLKCWEQLLNNQWHMNVPQNNMFWLFKLICQSFLSCLKWTVKIVSRIRE